MPPLDRLILQVDGLQVDAMRGAEAAAHFYARQDGETPTIDIIVPSECALEQYQLASVRADVPSKRRAAHVSVLGIGYLSNGT